MDWLTGKNPRNNCIQSLKYLLPPDCFHPLYSTSSFSTFFHPLIFFLYSASSTCLFAQQSSIARRSRRPPPTKRISAHLYTVYASWRNKHHRRNLIRVNDPIPSSSLHYERVQSQELRRIEEQYDRLLRLVRLKLSWERGLYGSRNEPYNHVRRQPTSKTPPRKIGFPHQHSGSRSCAFGPSDSSPIVR